MDRTSTTAQQLYCDCRYLIHSVRRGKSGLGDRIRGMLFATRLAAATGRVVLFTWKGDPGEPQTFFMPAGNIDWRVEGTGYSETPPTPPNSQSSSSSSNLALDMYTWVPEQQETLQRVKDGLLLRHASTRYVTIYTNERAEAPCKGCPALSAPLQPADAAADNNSSSSSSAACLFRLLFKPRWVEASVDNDALGGGDDVSFIPCLVGMRNAC